MSCKYKPSLEKERTLQPWSKCWGPWVLALLLSDSVTSDKLLSLSGPRLPPLKNENTPRTSI